MKLSKIYDIVVREGIAADPRGAQAVRATLERNKQRFRALEAKDREYADRESLSNPYEDSRILFGSPDQEIKTALVGIDIDGTELLLIDRLNSRNKEKIHLAISHHPQGAAFANFYEVMDMQAEIFEKFGIPINIGEKLTESRKGEVGRRLHAANHHRSVDTARLLGIPFMCVHTPADNHAATHLQELMDKQAPKTCQDILDLLAEIEEFKIARRQNVAPVLLIGSPQSRAGKIFVDMTGGTEGPKEILEFLQRAGVGTVLGMHMSEEHYKILKEKNINAVVAGHVASDNLGMNLILDKIEKAGKLRFLACSGFRRIKR